METTKIQPGATVYYYTFTVIHWLPVFVSAEACKIVTDSLNFCHHKKGLRINGYAIMPTHGHFILFDKDYDNDRLGQTVSAMRQYTGRQLIEFSEKKMPSVFTQLMYAPNRTDRKRPSSGAVFCSANGAVVGLRPYRFLNQPAKILAWKSQKFMNHMVVKS